MGKAPHGALGLGQQQGSSEVGIRQACQEGGGVSPRLAPPEHRSEHQPGRAAGGLPTGASALAGPSVAWRHLWTICSTQDNGWLPSLGRARRTVAGGLCPCVSRCFLPGETGTGQGGADLCQGRAGGGAEEAHQYYPGPWTPGTVRAAETHPPPRLALHPVGEMANAQPGLCSLESYFAHTETVRAAATFHYTGSYACVCVLGVLLFTVFWVAQKHPSIAAVMDPATQPGASASASA